MATLVSLALMITMMPLAAVSHAEEAGAGSGKETVNIAILSDIHYVSDENREAAGTDAFKDAEETENRLMTEIGLILDQTLKDASATSPDAMLVCGDLCSNGELENEGSLAAKLKTAKTTKGEGKGVYVVNGNHDINNSYGAHFDTSGVISNAQRTQADDFKRVYEGLGYGSDVEYYDATPDSEVKNYGGLSYATEIRDGITLIALDTA